MLLTGAILVFLPGYDEIIMLRDRIQDEKRFSDSSRSVILHILIRDTITMFAVCCIFIAIYADVFDHPSP